MHFKKIITIILCGIFCLPSAVQGKDLMNEAAVNTYYEQQEGEPLWVNHSRLTKDAKKTVDILKNSWMNGLNPKKYHLAQIQEILSEGRKIHPDNLTVLELLITDAATQYMRDLSGMRVNPASIGLNKKHWVQRISADEVLLYMKENKGGISKIMKQAEPQSASYQSLKDELIRLHELDAENDVPPFPYKQTLRPGRAYNTIPALRERLGLESAEENQKHIYDEVLVEAVKAFQQGKGLKPDGYVGKQTIFALNHSRHDKIRQIILNMERLRWLPREKPDRFIVVNIPSFTLWAVEDGKVEFEMPVVVGRKKRPTLSFVTEIHGVRYNPTWTVPKTIKKEDILPKLQESPDYLTGKGMELYDGYGAEAVTLDPTVVDWANVTEEELKGFKMVQGAGANNPLGRIRILMPNRHNIYLHDTNDKSLFYRTNRAKSSGCIRMKTPSQVSDFVLKTKAGWNEAKAKRVLAKKKTSDIYTSERMPVYMLYHTAWVGMNNAVIYGQDIYGNDKKLMQAIEKLDEFPIVNDNRIDVKLARR